MGSIGFLGRGSLPVVSHKGLAALVCNLHTIPRRDVRQVVRTRHVRNRKRGCPPSQLVHALLEPSSIADIETETRPRSFADLGVDPLLTAALARMGITTPAAIQVSAIPRLLSGASCALQSYTGSGKTLAYMLPTLTLALQRAEQQHAQGVSPSQSSVQVVVVAPSKELAMQIFRVARGLLPQEVQQAVQQCIGGANPQRQREALALHRPVMVVGTPGRIADMVKSAALQLHHCPILVVDEADQLMAPNFIDDMSHISNHTGKRVEGGRQTILVSATLTPSAMKKASQWCDHLEYVHSGERPSLEPQALLTAGSSGGTTLQPGWGWGVKGWEGPASSVAPRTQGTMGGVEQSDLVPSLPPHLQHLYVRCSPRDKVDTLRRVIHALGSQQVLVFMNWQQRLKDTQYKLEAHKMQVASLHGEMSKIQRQKVLEEFRQGQYRALVVNDVAARGLDLPACDLVVNLELPSNPAHYAHRAGRTGRMGAEGTVVNITGYQEEFVVEKLQEKLKTPIMEVHLQGGQVVPGSPPQSSRPRRTTPKEKDEGARVGKGASTGITDKEKESKREAVPLAASGQGRTNTATSSRRSEESLHDEEGPPRRRGIETGPGRRGLVGAAVSGPSGREGNTSSEMSALGHVRRSDLVRGDKNTKMDVKGKQKVWQKSPPDRRNPLGALADDLDDEDDPEDEEAEDTRVTLQELRKELEEIRKEKEVAGATPRPRAPRR